MKIEVGGAMTLFWQQIRFPLVCFLITLGLLWLGDVTYGLFGNVGVFVTLFFWSLSAVPLAISFYRMRRKHRLAYGIVELLTACSLFYVTMLNIIHGGRGTSISLELIALRALTFFALVYFMVRALDNIGEGLKPPSRTYARWEKLFPKS